MYRPTHFRDKLLPILWGRGSGKGEEQIGEAKVLLKTLMMGGYLVLVALGFTKWADIKFLPVLANTEKSCSLLRGSNPAPSISFFRAIGCFLNLRVGLSISLLSSPSSAILNFSLSLSTIEWSNPLFSCFSAPESLGFPKAGFSSWYFPKL